MATRYGRAGGNWSAAGTWSATSGGLSDGTGIATGDDVILDSASTGTFTIDAAASIASLDCTGFTGTLAHNAFTLTITGNTFKLVVGMTYSPSATRVILFTSTGTVLITTANKTLGTPQFNGTGGTFQFQDSFTWGSASTATLTAGTIDSNGQTVTGGLFSSTGVGVARGINPVGSLWTMTGVVGLVWDLSLAASNFTIGAGAWTLLISANATGSRSVNFGTSKTYSAVTLANGGTAGAFIDLTAATGVTIGTLDLTAPVNVRFNQTSTYTISNAVNWAGSAYNSAILLIAGNGLTPTLAMNGGTASWMAFQSIAVTGTAPTTSNSLDLKGNSGFTINGPTGGGGAVGVIGS